MCVCVRVCVRAIHGHEAIQVLPDKEGPCLLCVSCMRYQGWWLCVYVWCVVVSVCVCVCVHVV